MAVKKSRAKIKIEDFVPEPEHIEEIKKLEKALKQKESEIKKLEDIVEHQEVVIMVDLCGEIDTLHKTVKEQKQTIEGLQSDIKFLLNRFRVKEKMHVRNGNIVSIQGKRMCA